MAHAARHLRPAQGLRSLIVGGVLTEPSEHADPERGRRPADSPRLVASEPVVGLVPSKAEGVNPRWTPRPLTKRLPAARASAI